MALCAGPSECDLVSRPEREADIGKRMGTGGSWNSLPPGPDTTLVTDIYDCSCSPE